MTSRTKKKPKPVVTYEVERTSPFVAGWVRVASEVASLSDAHHAAALAATRYSCIDGLEMRIVRVTREVVPASLKAKR